MTTYICTGECGGVSDHPGTCQAETCSMHGQPLVPMPDGDDSEGETDSSE